MVEKRAAVFIDGDNVSPSVIASILDQLKRYGRLTIKKVYGDFSQPQLKSWEQAAKKHGLKIEHSYNRTTHKNATDIALVIDAMDTFHGDSKPDVFCIVSSDSDFTRLAERLAQGAVRVIGVGRSSVPQAVKEAYDEFLSIESMQEQDSFPMPAQATSSVSVGEAAGYVQQEDTSDEATANKLEQVYLELVAQNTEIRDGFLPLRSLRNEMQSLNLIAETTMPAFVGLVTRLAQQYPQWIEIVEEAGSKPIAHLVRFKRQLPPEIGRLQSAYARIMELRRDDEGWVLLSEIGTTLATMFPSDDPLVYKGKKYGKGKFKKVIEDMAKDDPKIKIDNNSVHPRVRM
jgi:hypothetical protein